MGYGLTGDVSEQVFFYLYGRGRQREEHADPRAHVHHRQLRKQAAPNLLVAKKSEEHPTGVADLHGARLIVTTEVESGDPWRSPWSSSSPAATR